jgi:hypothetical protein
MYVVGVMKVNHKTIIFFSLFHSLPFILSGSDEISLMVYAA